MESSPGSGWCMAVTQHECTAALLTQDGVESVDKTTLHLGGKGGGGG